MKASELKECPVCGRKPKVKYYFYPTGYGCAIQCKPLFGRIHLMVERYTASEERSYLYAVEDWNREAMQ